ncbi:MAG: gliding motility-associated ABC transporter permease subunit GldF [Flavobacterium sp. BFFFF2]|nr:MAG: gliding motility-associated ABC transporter permease subunit GldF [Flavobacterium sp. BFFFF2]
MKAIIRKELLTFFGSPMGYLIVSIYLILNGLFIWVLDNPYNVLLSGFADLTAFFSLTPWIFLVFIPAITMRSLSEEIRSGTLEVLLTKPISRGELALGKNLGSLAVVMIALIPTLAYVWVLNGLTLPNSELDWGAIFGSYIGLVVVAASFCSIGIFCSSLTSNQIVAFLGAAVLSFCLYYLPEATASQFPAVDFFAPLGMSTHFHSLARGVISLADLLYFLVIGYIFWYGTRTQLQRVSTQYS